MKLFDVSFLDGDEYLRYYAVGENEDEVRQRLIDELGGEWQCKPNINPAIK